MESSPLLPCRREAGLLFGIFFLALLLRAWSVGHAPLHPDEIHYAFDFLEAAETGTLGAVRDVHCAMLIERRTAHPPVVMLLTRWLWAEPFGALWPPTAGFLRGFNVLVGALTVFPLWAAGRLLGGATRGLAAALLGAITPGLVWVARTLYLDPVFGFLIASLVAVLLWQAHSRNWGVVALAGALLGLALSTKISAPLLVPPALLAVAVAGAGRGRWQERAAAVLLAAAAATLVFLALNDPHAYLNAIVHPTDPRYRSNWDSGGLSNYLNILFISLHEFSPAVLWDGGLWLALLGAFGVRRAVAERRWIPELLLAVGFVALLPLVLMHLGRLSGHHGLLPLHLLLALLASGGLASIPTVTVRRALLGTTVAAALLVEGVRTWPLQLPADRTIEFAADPQARFDLLRPHLHRRCQILLLPSGAAGRGILPWGNGLRQGQLTERAQFLAPVDGMEVSEEALQWADVLLRDAGAPLPFELGPEFVREGANALGEVYVRQGPPALRSAPAASLVPAGNGAWVLPGNVYPITGGVEAAGGEGELVLDGFVNYLEWGTGVLRWKSPPGPGTQVRLLPPQRSEVFWSF